VNVDAVFAALADPTRRAVIGRLAQEPLSASALAGELPVSRQAVAKHLAALDRAGLVRSHREGREQLYRLDPAPLTDAMEWMAAVGARWDDRLSRLQRRAERAKPGHGPKRAKPG
jgi:DNA-binding transcriptional ArsR family regulator